MFERVQVGVNETQQKGNWGAWGWGKRASKSITNPSVAILNLTFSREIPPNSGEFVNSPEDYLKKSNLVKISVCEDVQNLLKVYPQYDLNFEWSFEKKEKVLLKTIQSKNCSIVWKAPFQGNFSVTVSVKDPDHSELFFQGSSEFKIIDYWIVSIGDSFASGEGNPDKNLLADKKVEWIDGSCHRSRKSWTYFVYEKLEKYSRKTLTHFTYIPCAGASVDHGILDSENSLSQMDVVEEIMKIRGKGPDLLLMSVGGNDVGFSDILGRLLLGNSRSLFNSIQMRLFFLSHELERLGEKIKLLKPSQDLFQIGNSNLRLADRQITKKVNKIISEKSKFFNWTVVEKVPEIFKTGGVCSSTPLIRTSQDSVRIQGDSSGALHPVEDAHRKIADLVWKKLDFQSLLRV
ncbi:hypothetical protein FO519_004469 [Halicephalobus sp. NKZ332]|nr:hypothetical protein FO519_004469 [Halicephalobus sp. NKZ332]